MVGWKCGMEVSNLMLTSGKRPDVVRYMPTSNVLTDVRTIAAAHNKCCKWLRVFLATVLTGCR